MEKLKNITLEISLKPFNCDDEQTENVCRQIFTQWSPLLRYADGISLMLWTADGSEILDYAGELDQSFEWCYHISTANPPPHLPLEWASKIYRSSPEIMTYRRLKFILDTMRRVGSEFFPNKPLSLIETFDIGPEFAISSFKYERHREILGGNGEGIRTMFVDSTSALHADDRKYAAFKNGIPEGTPFATFLGKQAEIFLADMGFDSLWLSNGMGFSVEPWQAEGKVFSNGIFNSDAIESTQAEVMRFWELLRREMPNVRIETRGTNLSLGIDYSTDAVPLYSLYKSGFNFLPPCNSPWAALDGNYGLEIMGHMSRNAVLPDDEDWLFRYYIHDPWFKNSPWYDRYEGSPCDIYPLLALSRINEHGETMPQNHLNLLSIDNSYGTMPDACVVEPTAHLIRALREAPDSPSPFVWLYPAREYCEVKDEYRLREMYGSDWLIADAINHSFPLSGVISTDAFLKTDLDILKNSILLSHVPYSGSEWEKRVIEFAEGGGKLILVGALTRASDKLKSLLCIKTTDSDNVRALLPDFALLDKAASGEYSRELIQDNISGVPCFDAENDGIDSSNCIFSCDGALLAKGKNNIYWICGAQTGIYQKGSSHLVVKGEDERADGGAFLRNAAKYFGWDISLSVHSLSCPEPSIMSPKMMLHRHDNGFFYSFVNRNTTVELSLSSPYGAPLLMGYETEFKEGMTSYRLPRAERLECRVFLVKNEENMLVSAREALPCHAISRSSRRTIEVRWLKNATVRVFPESYAMDSIFARVGALDSRRGDFIWRREGDSYVAENITGTLEIFFPDYDDWREHYKAIAERESKEYSNYDAKK